MIEIKKQRCDTEYQSESGDIFNRKQIPYKFKQAMQCLEENYEPDIMLCRDQQIKRIKEFIKDFISTGYAKQSLYISGVPGIGKTLSVKKVFEYYKDREECRKNKVKFINLNAMQLKQQADIYKLFYNKLLGCTSKGKKDPKISYYSSMVKLDTIFRRNQVDQQIDQQIIQMKKVVLIDELDYLKTKDEEILYNIFDWTQSQGSKLAIIAISNTIDFPERLKQKIMSRIGNNRLVFKPYNRDELQTILKQRVQKSDVFEDNVLNFISKKIAKCSSDIRKCFQILNESIYLHLRQYWDNDLKNSKVSTKEVNRAYDSVYSDHFTEAFKCMPKIYKQILAILAQYFLRDTKMLTFESIKQMARTSYSIQANQVNCVLQALIDLGLVQFKYTLNPSTNFKSLKKWSYKLIIEADRVQYSVLKFDQDLAV